MIFFLQLVYQRIEKILSLVNVFIIIMNQIINAMPVTIDVINVPPILEIVHNVKQENLEITTPLIVPVLVLIMKQKILLTVPLTVEINAKPVIDSPLIVLLVNQEIIETIILPTVTVKKDIMMMEKVYTANHVPIPAPSVKIQPQIV